MRAFGILTAAAALSACTMGGTGLSPEAIARGQAKSVVNSVVAQKMPGVNAAPVTDCIIDNASMSEIYSISRGAVVGVDADTVNTVMTIAKRPDTLSCITRNGLSLL
ncbi:succinate dehydrogenase [Paenirhodobacter populi]|uniref:Succinate dehydrogenase n=1 Tax=Paenirhodobacter populi TaxID=2306993 RepID=A0A443KC65_9RHOB|nr:succinate dehydrogenase [Sinirhodobacter populi]RWR23680.1 succinate dehydrogenase [Sinirhodobacter populi]RWR30325.1 succinate dehydrogenase [Sinirhodobacter populi]RWR32298.1 succinate dehydrogenase [Sinirhodobacter populi]